MSLSLFSMFDSFVSKVINLQSCDELSIAKRVVVVVAEKVRFVISGYPGKSIRLRRLPSEDKTATSPLVSNTDVSSIPTVELEQGDIHVATLCMRGDCSWAVSAIELEEDGESEGTLLLQNKPK